MESVHIHDHDHDHELQDQIFGSSSASSPSLYYDWTPNSNLNTNGFNSYPEETILMNPRQQMASEISEPHRANSPNLFEHDLQLLRIKEEISYNYYLKYTEILNSSSPLSSSNDELSIRSDNLQYSDGLESTKKLLLSSFSSDNLSNKENGLSQQINVPNINSNREGIMLASPGSWEMNLHPLDHLQLPYSSRFEEYFSQNRIGMMRDGFSCNLDHLHQSCVDLKPRLFNSNKIPEAEAKRSSCEMEPKALQNAPKKSRFEASASCPLFKVRKERLGDRVAALQQLVAPYGKICAGFGLWRILQTDTASVLMEAIGYIKFLQTQVETLSVPYMKTSSRMIKTVTAENKNDEPKRDLKSRGLCLVPLSCMSYFADGGGGAAIWSPPYFGGAA